MDMEVAEIGEGRKFYLTQKGKSVAREILAGQEPSVIMTEDEQDAVVFMSIMDDEMGGVDSGATLEEIGMGLKNPDIEGVLANLGAKRLVS